MTLPCCGERACVPWPLLAPLAPGTACGPCLSASAARARNPSGKTFLRARGHGGVLGKVSEVEAAAFPTAIRCRHPHAAAPTSATPAAAAATLPP